MTILTLKTNDEEKNALEKGDQSFVIRSDKYHVTRGDLIKFQLMKMGKTVASTLDAKMFMVTNVMDYHNAPIERGFQLINFKEVRK